jgi:hypothetical protein
MASGRVEEVVEIGREMVLLPSDGPIPAVDEELPPIMPNDKPLSLLIFYT